MKHCFRLAWYAVVGTLVVVAHHAADIAFTVGLTALAIGLWWERPSLALIVPGVIVLAVCVVGRMGIRRED